MTTTISQSYCVVASANGRLDLAELSSVLGNFSLDKCQEDPPPPITPPSYGDNIIYYTI
jgi:hypothetical protein